MKQNRNVSYLNQNKTKLNYVIKFSLIECSLFITTLLAHKASLKQFSVPIAKYTSPRLSDTTFIARYKIFHHGEALYYLPVGTE